MNEILFPFELQYIQSSMKFITSNSSTYFAFLILIVQFLRNALNIKVIILSLILVQIGVVFFLISNAILGEVAKAGSLTNAIILKAQDKKSATGSGCLII